MRIRKRVTNGSLKAWRRENHLSQRQAAALLDMGQGTYTKYETGRAVPRKPRLKLIIERTGVPLERLMGLAS